MTMLPIPSCPRILYSLLELGTDKLKSINKYKQFGISVNKKRDNFLSLFSVFVKD